MSAQPLLDMLVKVKSTGPSRWIACCPAHDDRSPSLAIRETPEGQVLVHCFAGCAFEDVIASAGIHVSELFPDQPPPIEGKRPERRPFLPSDVFDILRLEAGVVWVIGCDLHKNRSISEESYQRLCEATARIERIAEAAYGR